MMILMGSSDIESLIRGNSGRRTVNFRQQFPLILISKGLINKTLSLYIVNSIQLFHHLRKTSFLRKNSDHFVNFTLLLQGKKN